MLCLHWIRQSGHTNTTAKHGVNSLKHTMLGWIFGCHSEEHELIWSLGENTNVSEEVTLLSLLSFIW